LIAPLHEALHESVAHIYFASGGDDLADARYFGRRRN
jgi:hypothetical protein